MEEKREKPRIPGKFKEAEDLAYEVIRKIGIEAPPTSTEPSIPSSQPPLE
jgi:hypothetical protein